MDNEGQTGESAKQDIAQQDVARQDVAQQHVAQPAAPADVDGLKDKTPDELTPEELRLMADTMPGDGPGD